MEFLCCSIRLFFFVSYQTQQFFLENFGTSFEVSALEEFFYWKDFKQIRLGLRVYSIWFEGNGFRNLEEIRINEEPKL